MSCSARKTQTNWEGTQVRVTQLIRGEEELLKRRVTKLNTQVLLINSFEQSKMKYFHQSHTSPWGFAGVNDTRLWLVDSVHGSQLGLQQPASPGELPGRRAVTPRWG